MISKDSRFLSFFAVLAVLTSLNASLAYANVEETAPKNTSLADSEIITVDKTPMFFSIQEGNNNDAMARKALERVLKRAETEVGRHIPLGVARVDLNGDGILELFVRLLDQDLFCKADDCQVYGFAVTETGFIKIADLQARTIDIMDKKNEGAKNLHVVMTDENAKDYVWDGKQYNLSAEEKETAKGTGGAE